ncbi:MAG: CDP-glucose 4,6-dehydratase [Opitutae bacterium]|nr:CDP-glucose 4,6-dehydratase [Opitutae bacterium]
MFHDFYRGRKVFVTGHTGFKGSWLCEWLLLLGAEVTGYSLPAENGSLFAQLGLATRIGRHIEADIRDPARLAAEMTACAPDVVFHLAAQPLVRLSYAHPVETYATNVMGTVHVLSATRQLTHPCTVVVVTTDKCYENREWVHSYREEDSMGGWDPYSSSKGCAELVVSAFRRSYFPALASTVRLASARAGNVIGGGDWALDRIVPDCVRSLKAGDPIPVRNKVATRPWQHVLEPLSGYLLLGARLATAEGREREILASAFNLGPAMTSNRTVADLVAEILRHWPGRWEDRSDPHAVHEAKLLNLATDKAYHHLGWQPVWPFAEAIEQTVTWYRQDHEKTVAAPALTRGQIQRYAEAAGALSLSWTQ